MIKTSGIYMSSKRKLGQLLSVYCSSDETILKGGAGMHTTVLDDTTDLTSYGVGNIASNFSCKLTAIQEALREYVNLNDTDRARGLVIYCDSKAALEAILQVVRD
ncbi:hypothetical protein NPIL_549651 [Nephila pilipes]|uniref:Uncharacterized protein n=1 Tax=Nephila pilipes TaxID=299642 RepID=A0A8X6TBT1_NEPPI|nr:hypothetical protein NPIL_549651 [Nephila pilipes]